MKNSVLVLAACWLMNACASDHTKELEADTGCTTAALQTIEERVGSGDGAGHGPDIASAEWYSVIEFRLGVRGLPLLPEAGTHEWCEQMLNLAESSPSAAGPSFDCTSVRPGSMEERVCQQPSLAKLDLKMDTVYQQAVKLSDEHMLPNLRAQQRGWIKGRDDCWKSAEPDNCIALSYQQRISELQAWYRLVNHSDPVDYQCGESPANVITVSFFQSLMPALVAERGDQAELMYLQASASGTKYSGRNHEFWEHSGEARVVWGTNSTVMTCTKVTTTQ
ncbi:DUF1311 domain-containing protein [Alteromonas aestuariivivens]|uniref:DUF1311 domain-containing protein n=1 Tax=Alteromonas aestuariivivens TaxID=1938339 RepID=A0A3D8MBK5_9ALTE|nr:MliC family protein [Alteromonas aestuariivivens]RDV26792.1 DUF1311 domain-containing protein [Alteromonas aestuariivivens]